MFSKEESRQLRELFWTSYGKSFPRKWILYNTKIKDFSFKFQANRKTAFVCLDIENQDEFDRLIQFEKLESLKIILENEFLPDAIYDNDYFLEESGKTICRIYVNHQKKFSIHNKDTWRDAFEFFNETMDAFERFFLEYEDFIKIIES